MTDFEYIIIVYLLIMFLMLLIIASHIPFKIDKETKELLKQIRNNTMDKTKPVKPINVTSKTTRVTRFANCPICGKLTSSSFKHCDNCGATIDWSDTE